MKENEDRHEGKEETLKRIKKDLEENGEEKKGTE